MNYPQQQYQGYRPVQPQQAWNMPTPQIRPVASIDEVRAYPIDFDGSIFYFPDVAHKRIYTKSVNMDGTVAISVYELQETPLAADQLLGSSYVTKQEFEEVVNSLKAMYEEVKKEIPEAAAQPEFRF